MLVVRVELWPGGDERRAREIARAGIANVSDLSSVSDYVVVTTDPAGNVTGEALVTGHRRSDGPWLLVARAAAAALAETGTPLGKRWRSTAAAIVQTMTRRARRDDRPRIPTEREALFG